MSHADAPSPCPRASRSRPRVIAVAAAYNEAENLAEVTARIIELGHEIIIVDDGSRDDTAGVASRNGAYVLRHPTNFGQSQGLVTGFRAALKEDCDYIVEMDVDGQHDADDITRFVEAMESRPEDIIVGSRVLGGNHPNAPFARRFFLPHVTWVINTLSGYRMTDAMCGFRIFRAESLRRAPHVITELLEPQYIAAELFMRASRAGFTVGEIPIYLRDRRTGTSHKGLVRYGIGVMKAIMRGLS